MSYKQIKINLKKDEASKLADVKRVFGFRSDYQLAAACVRLVVSVLHHEIGAIAPDDLHNEVYTLFNSLAFSDYSGVEPKSGKVNSGACHLNLILGVEDSVREEGVCSSESLSVSNNRAFADRFVIENYKEISKKYSNDKSCRSDMMTPLDVAHDMLLRLYRDDNVYRGGYKEFEDFYKNKFKIK